MIPTNNEGWWRRYHQTLTVGDRQLSYWSLKNLSEDFQVSLEQQPFVMRLFLENIMRHYEADAITPLVIAGLFAAADCADKNLGSAFYPSRVLMQDYTGVPAIADLAAMRDTVAEAGGAASR